MPPEKKTDKKLMDLVVKRKGLHTLRDSVEKFVSNFNEEVDLCQIPVRLESLDRTYGNYLEVQTEIERLDEPELLEGHLTERADFETRYCAIKGFLLSRRSVDAHQTMLNNSLNATQHQHSASFHLRLPKIDLPKFNGDFSHWLSFRDTYSSMVHSNADIPTVAKLQYLLQSLQGEARKPFESVGIEADNYATVWDALLKRYDNRRFLKRQLFRTIHELPPMKKESAQELHELVDEFQRHVKALAKLNEPVEHWDTPLVYMLTNKLDPTTLRAWEEKTGHDEAVEYDDLIEFLYNRVRILKSVASDLQQRPQVGQIKVAGNNPNQRRSFPSRIAANASTSESRAKSPSCFACSESHYLFQCPTFADMPVIKRRELVSQKRLCWNCFRTGHQARSCGSRYTCRTCRDKHHTLLHCTAPLSKSSTNAAVTSQDPSLNPSTATDVESQGTVNQNPEVSMPVVSRNHTVLLETVALQVVDDNGQEFNVRALLDSASMSNFISKRLAKLLSNHQASVDVAVAGIGQSVKKLNRTVTATVKSRTKHFARKMLFLIIDDPTADLPTMPINRATWKLPDVPLADPDFHVPGEIDLVIGGETYWALHTGKKIVLGQNQPLMVETHFGWTISGRTVHDSTKIPQVCSTATKEDRLEAAIQRFWELEAIATIPPHSVEEKRCEEIYTTTTTRNPSGRFIVRLPKVESADIMLGLSRSMAERRFLSLERRLNRDPSVHDAYHQFMTEYENLGHMRKLSEPVNNVVAHFYLPHHPVFKASSTTTKTRVVFDASSKSTSGLSLNDLLLVGPVVQQDLLSLIMRFRTHPVALVADIEKMYRQVQVHPEDHPFQRILWRATPSDPIATYELQTVTYGTASAPYLATRTIKQLAEDSKESFPKAADAMSDDFYVDDFLSGTEDIKSAVRIRREISSILSSAGFPIKKWASNAPEVLAEIPADDRAIQPFFDLQDEQSVNTLGLIWEPKSDTLMFKVQLPPPSAVLTKRKIMSYIAQIFDPLGLIGPTIATAKIFMQRLWALKDENDQRYDWDCPLPLKLQAEWKQFHHTLDLLRQVRVPRFASQRNPTSVQLHFFADASEKAYGACCFIRVESPSGVSVQLVASKSKVAPLSTHHSIARLELLAARLAVQLFKKVTAALHIPDVIVNFWSDSTVTLHWLNSPPARWKPFVRNSTSVIQQATDISSWRHVPGVDNPADDISRGLSPIDILNRSRWWNGPHWLSLSSESWPATTPFVDESLESSIEKRKAPLVVMSVTEYCFWDDLFSRFSSYTKLRRVTAYAKRYLSILRDRLVDRNTSYSAKINCEAIVDAPSENSSNNKVSWLTTDELNEAEYLLCRIAQQASFPEELSELKAKERVSRSSSMKWLKPAIDHKGLIRVGGRLSNAKIPEAGKHPIVLSSQHPLCGLLVLQCHNTLLHAGPQLMLATLRQKFWILGARNLARRTYHECVTCFRNKPVLVQQSIADLPTSRVTPTRPFSVCGVDYCGPFFVKSSFRKQAPRKAYVAIFVCFSTRAVHIELVSDLSTPAFIAALRRLVARRGKITELHSDNGTAFKGASNALHRVYRMLKIEEKDREQIFSWCANNEICWKFIPPRAPHFGGLWEAAVKSAKRHLLKEMGNSSISYEDLQTLLAEVEMVLNSRPLTAMPSDTVDIEVLTPGHFLVGSSLQAVPEPCVKDIPDNRLDHWKLTEKHFQRIWSRWYPEYLQQLQSRASKGCNRSVPIQPGRIVIIKEDNLPPAEWPLGKITAVHPGRDGVVRVVTLRTASAKNVVRAVARIALLPLPNDPEELITEAQNDQ